MNRLVLSFLASLVLPGAGFAQNSKSLQDDIRRFPEGISPDCRAVANNMARLSCWDGQALKHSQSEELTILSLDNAFTASGLCSGFKLDTDKVARTLAMSGLTASDIYNKPRSAKLQSDIEAQGQRWTDDNKQKACADAWDDYGPGGALGQYLTK